MPDYIEIHDLLVRTIIGINPDEREQRQDVVVNLRLETDLREAAKNDEIQDTLNYRTVCKEVIELVEGSRYQLVERLAEAIAAACLAHPRVSAVRVSVEKPGALRFARSVGVVIERRHHDR